MAMDESSGERRQSDTTSNNNAHHHHESNFFDDIRKYRASDEKLQQEGYEQHNNAANHWSILLLGQAVALAAAGNSAASYALEYNFKVVVPIFLLFLTYLMLAIPHLWCLRRRQRSKITTDDKQPYRLPFTNGELRLSAPWWTYLALAVLDLEGNYLMMLSFKYTSLSSSTLLSSISVPATMIFSVVLMARVFRLPHYVGACLCLLGGAMAVWVDDDDDSAIRSSDSPTMMPSHPHALTGDILAVATAVLYGAGDTAGELFVKHVDRVEYLAMLGLFGTIIAAIQVPLLESDALVAVLLNNNTMEQWRAIIGLTLCFLAAVVSYYIGATLFYLYGDATLLNLSLRTVNLWAILFDIVAEREPPSFEFYGALLLMMTGMIIYEVCPGRTTSSTMRPDHHHHHQATTTDGADDDDYRNRNNELDQLLMVVHDEADGSPDINYGSGPITSSY